MTTTELEQLRATSIGATLPKTAPPARVSEPKKKLSGSGSYYKSHFAREVQIAIDHMIEDGEDCQYAYEQFSHLKHSALYLRITQSVLYLMRELDTPEGKYTEFRKKFEITKESSGVCLRFRKKLIPTEAGKVNPKDERNQWKEALEDILQNGKPNTQYTIPRLQLTLEEQIELRASLFEIKNLYSMISGSDIVIVKLEQETSNDPT